jgi:purine-binding chemotaxis protein CheW
MTTAEPVAVVVCAIGEQAYAIPVADILEVAALVEITPLPEAPQEVLGVVNRRGAIIPLLDLRLCLGQSAPPSSLSTLFVVVQAGEQVAGLIVDDVRAVITLPSETLKPRAKSGPYVKGLAVIDDDPLLVLSTAALLNNFAPSELGV